MRVLQINSVCGYGSTGRITTDLYDMLTEVGHECCIAYGRGKAPSKYRAIKIGNKLDFFSHVLKTRLFDLHGFGSTAATKKFIKKIKEYNPDIIHIHNIHGYYVNIEILFDYLSSNSIPVIWLLHDAWCMSGHGAHFELNSDGSIPTKNLDKKKHKEYPKSFIYDNSKKNYMKKKNIFSNISNMTIVTPSNWLSNLAKKSFLKEYNIETIYNGIDLKIFKPINNNNFRIKNGLQNKKLILGVANIWSNKKGLEIFNQLADKLDSSYKIVLVGVNKKNEKKINGKILCLRRTDSLEKLASIYSAADVFVNPTFEDNFPTTNIEALACGTPVITFNTGGSLEAIDATTGLVVKNRTSESLLESIMELKQKKITKENCLNRAKKFNKNDVYKKYIKLYESVITKGQ